VQVFCGRASMRLQLSSRPFAGTQTGACTRNDSWTIATVRFPAPDQCDVQTIDRYTTTHQACTAFLPADATRIVQ